MKLNIKIFSLALLLMALPIFAQQFVVAKNGKFYQNGKPYYYIGTNYWYGTLLGLQKDPTRGIDRLKKELDFLKDNGVKNLRVMAGAEGEGLINGIVRVGPAYQKEPGVFEASTLKGLDILLDEMAKRDMKAVIFFSNNWEWSGGFLQYLRWNNKISEEVFRKKMEWEAMRDNISMFYSCSDCINQYRQQVKNIVTHKNTINGRLYKNDPTIMTWEIANEPRPMRPAAIEGYKKFILQTAAYIKALDKNHLITTGSEGYIGSESKEVFNTVHNYKNIDYLTIHIWPKNWQWYPADKLPENFTSIVKQSLDYMNWHLKAARKMQKPLVLEEFGLVRDGNSFSPEATTKFRDSYYRAFFDEWAKSKKNKDNLAGVAFWSFSGYARPIPGQIFWKEGDDYMGDPTFEEQGLYGVFTSDVSTWETIKKYSLKK